MLNAVFQSITKRIDKVHDKESKLPSLDIKSAFHNGTDREFFLLLLTV